MAEIQFNQLALLAQNPPLTDRVLIYPAAGSTPAGTPDAQANAAAAANPPGAILLSTLRTMMRPDGASESESGLVSLATATEAAAGTDAAKAVTAAGVAAAITARASGGTIAFGEELLTAEIQSTATGFPGTDLGVQLELGAWYIAVFDGVSGGGVFTDGITNLTSQYVMFKVPSAVGEFNVNFSLGTDVRNVRLRTRSSETSQMHRGATGPTNATVSMRSLRKIS